ncbi:MAG: hypothetical protein WC864_04930 [Ilumatobacteraceae bacterium]
MFLAGALLLASCGSSDSGGTSDTTGTTITKADFVEQANAKCVDLSERISAGQDALGSAPTDAEISAFVSDVIVVDFKATFDDIRDLGFPEGDEDLLEGILTDTEDILDEIAKDPIASFVAESPFVDVNARFNDYGLTACGEA